MEKLILTDKHNKFKEVLMDFDLESFKYEYELNSTRTLTFKAFKTNMNAELYDLILNEALLIWFNQYYVIKKTTPQSDNLNLTNEVSAHHIMYEFQNHYVNKDLESEEMNSDEDDEELPTPTWTLEQFLDFGFKDNKLGYTYEIVGKFNQRMPIDDVGDKNGIEHLVQGAELFEYIFLADNKKIYIFDDETFFKMSDVQMVAGYNVDEANVTVDTQEQKTYIRGFGKKKTKAETKNYNPIKTPDLSFKGTFIKEGTWYTETRNNSYSKRFNCRWGNETLTLSIKKGSLGGIIDIYLDGEVIESVNTYNKTTITEQIVVEKNLSKGYHTIEVVFAKPADNVDYKGKKPRMYVGTEKATILNLTAVLKGTDLYHVTDEYYSPYYDKNEPKVAATFYDDKITSKDELRKRLIEELNDEPVVELSTNYLDNIQLSERDMVYFKHLGLGFDTTLKVNKLTLYHPSLNLPAEVDFSNKKTDILNIQQSINRRIKDFDKQINKGIYGGTSTSLQRLASDAFGSVLVNE